MPSLTHPDAVYLGMDAHKDSISVGILNPGHERPDVEKIFNDEESVRRLIDRFSDRSLLWSCYEAGPTGYDLARLLQVPWSALRGHRPLDDPQGHRRQGEDRQSRLPTPGPPAPGR